MNRIGSLLVAFVSALSIGSVACTASDAGADATPAETAEKPATLAAPERDPSVIKCITNFGDHEVTADQCRQLLKVAGCNGGAVVNDTMKCSTATTEEPAPPNDVRTDVELTRDLATMARAQGTRDGRLVVRDAAGGESELVVDGVTYVRGAPVARGASFTLCQANRGSCIVLPAPGGTAFECGPDVLDDGNTHCGCIGVLDCFKMATSDVCDGPADCSGNSCTCPF